MTTGDVVYSLRFSLIKILPEPGFDLGSTAGESCVLTARLHMLYVCPNPLSICPTLRLFLGPTVVLSGCLPVRLSACPIVCLSDCLPVRLSACPVVCLSGCLSLLDRFYVIKVFWKHILTCHALRYQTMLECL